MKKTKSITLAVIGAGRVAQHYKLILDSGVVSGFSIVGVCDIDYKAAESLSRHWRCGAYVCPQKMLDDLKPDLVLVLTPSGMHFEHAFIALEAGSHVLVEKPVTLLPSDAVTLMNLADSKSLMLGVAFQNRLNPAIQCLKSAVQHNRFGSITSATVRLRWCRHQNYYDDEWHGTWAMDGGVINQQAIHHVDALNWLVGPVEAVCAFGCNRLNRLEAEDTMVALIRFVNGAVGTIEATTAARPRDIEASLSVVGEFGIAVIGGTALNKIDIWEFDKSQPEDPLVPKRFSQDVPNGYGLSHGPLLKGTIDRLRQGITEPIVSVRDCIQTSELVHALYASHEQQGWVMLKSKPMSMKLGVNK
jgi:predicted dehydrogenase